MKAKFVKYQLEFKEIARTSREEMMSKQTYFLLLDDGKGRTAVGECAVFKGLSCDDRVGYEEKLTQVCKAIERGDEIYLAEWPSIRFGVESAMRQLECGGILFPSEWTEGRAGIRINGLVWMGSASQMLRRVSEKLKDGFGCLKLKIGGIKFDDELAILQAIRERYSSDRLEIRLDANGSFSAKEAMDKLHLLSRFDIHSIEQPIKAGQWEAMSELCNESPIPIALDEELIGVNKCDDKYKMLNKIKPRYIILKPSLCGGFTGSDEWIAAANACGAGWWATSALESNVGLNAIAQWVFVKGVNIPQGLGTGELYVNNINGPIRRVGEELFYNPQIKWEYPEEWMA